MTTYELPMFERLVPLTPWAGGRVTDTDVLELTEAAAMASIHAGVTVTIKDFLRAAGRGEISLKAIIHRTTKVQSYDGGVYCNAGQENENIAPAGAVPTLPLTACQHLTTTGRASWRTFDGFEMRDGVLCRYTKGILVPCEPDFETVPDDCRVMGYAVHALADAFKETDTQTQAAQALPADTEAAPAGTVTVWTPERKANARKMLDKLRSQGVRDFARRTAESFNVSTTRLNTVLGKGKPQKKPKKITSPWSV